MRTMSSSLACVFLLGFTAAVGAQQIECRAADSGIDPNNLPQVGSPVLTLEYPIGG